jgi:glycosyltransferase involved in cell wall biosynthesis
MAGDLHRCEMIVVDDGSTDDTPEILQRWVMTGQLPLRQVTTAGIGPGQARELGARHAKAPWVALVDADERFSAGWLQAALEFVDNPGDAVGCEGVVEICDRHKISLFSHQTQSHKPGRFLTANLILKSDLVRFYEGYGRRYYFREDSDLAFQLLHQGFSMAHSSELLLYHPPLPDRWWKPIRLGLRYQYDGLLARRFPREYWHEVDYHYVLGQKVPHLRLVIYLIGIFLQLAACLVILVFGMSKVSITGFVLLLIFSSLIALSPILSYLPISQIRLSQLPVALSVYLIVPWVTITSWLYGFWMHRHQPAYKVP